jgi:tetratricopeptide (TPR) repeat protein
MKKNFITYIILIALLILFVVVVGFLIYKYKNLGTFPAPKISLIPANSNSSTVSPSPSLSMSGDQSSNMKPPLKWEEFIVKDRTLSQDYVLKIKKDFDSRAAALKKDPTLFNDWVALGNDKKLAGDYEGAKDIYIFAGQIRPLNSLSFGNLGDLYMNFLKDYPNAEIAFKRAVVNAGTENSSYIRNLIDLYHFWGKSDLEKQTILEAISKFPNEAQFLVLMSRWYSGVGDKANAIIYMQKALDLDPQNQAIQRELSDLESK